MGASNVAAFPTRLATDRRVSTSTRNQVRSALLFFISSVELPWLDEVVGARRGQRLPVVLTPSEVRASLVHTSGTMGLMIAILCGTGMRLMECVRLRVKDMELIRRELLVRQGKGNKDHITVLPENLVLLLQTHSIWVKTLHDRDPAEGFGAACLSDVLHVKYRHAGKMWGWQWVFPRSVRCIAPRASVERRHQLA